MPKNPKNEELQVQALQTSNDGTARVGINASYFTDPTDKDYVFICPDIYVEQIKDPAPRHIMLLVDTSSSMRGEGINAVKAVLPQVFAGLRPSDRVSLSTFSRSLKAVITNQSKEELEKSFQTIMTKGLEKLETATALNAAVLSLQNIPVAEAKHTTVLLFSDGQNNMAPQMSVPDIIRAVNEAFGGHPPRILPIGLGENYAHEYIKSLAITCNYGMIDARDQSQLPTFVSQMTNSLAHGVHVDLSVGHETIHTGILDYGTDNKHTPIRVRRTDMRLGFQIGGNGRTTDTDLFETRDKKEQRDFLQTFIKAEARKIYDDISSDFTKKLGSVHLSHP